jgi:hypothetical protein
MRTGSESLKKVGMEEFAFSQNPFGAAPCSFVIPAPKNTSRNVKMISGLRPQPVGKNNPSQAGKRGCVKRLSNCHQVE